jgi:hypothetical protein
MIDVIIPTCKTQPEIADLAAEIVRTAGCSIHGVATCQSVSAAANRNWGLDHVQHADLCVIMVDDDVCEFPQGWAVKLWATLMDKDDRTGCMMASARLLNPDHTLGPMLREPPPIMSAGLTVAKSLPTACIATAVGRLRFDENFIGSGWEDDDWCAQLRQKYPKGTFIINEDVRVVHRNEMKNQGFIKGQGPVPGGNFEKNQAYYESKWGERC